MNTLCHGAQPAVYRPLERALTPQVVDAMSGDPALADVLDVMRRDVVTPVDPKTGLLWANQYLASPDFNSWLAYDQLTFPEDIEPAMERRVSPLDDRKSFVAMFIDGDGYKEINYTYGHEGGDMAIISLARYIRASFGVDSPVLRKGGDEFVVLAKHVPTLSLDQFKCSVTNRMRTVPLDINGRTLIGSATVGFADCDMRFIRGFEHGSRLAEHALAGADKDLVRAKHARYRHAPLKVA